MKLISMKASGFGIIAIILMASCQSEESTEKLGKELIKVEKDFSKMSEEKGMAEAFIYYADRKVIKPQSGKQPIIGKLALVELLKNEKQDFVLTWEPLKAEVSGDLGYTFGNYFFKTKTPDLQRDTTFYGNYVSIWKRQSDGSWRYVLDTGNPTPEPSKLH